MMRAICDQADEGNHQDGKTKQNKQNKPKKQKPNLVSNAAKLPVYPWNVKVGEKDTFVSSVI